MAAGVRASIAHQKAMASRDDLAQVSTRAVLRENNLTAWLKFPNPLAYCHINRNDVFSALLNAVSVNDKEVGNGLKNLQHFATTRSAFAQSLFDMSKPSFPSSPRAPVLKNGSFLPVLTIAHASLLTLLEGSDQKEKNEFVLNTILKSLAILKITFFPAPKLRARRVGAPNSKPIFDSWGHLGLVDTTSIVIHPYSSPSIISPTTVAFNNTIADDCNAEWSASTLNLMTLPDVLNKTSLPIDFKSPSLADVPYVDDTYTWVRENYDGRKPLHHLALLVSIIVASSILPNLFMPDPADSNFKSRFSKATTKTAVRKVYEDMDWIPKNRKGLKEKPIILCMFTTFIIALYEEGSPLRMKMKMASRGGLGEPWTKKHCKSFLYLFFPFYISFLLAIKGVTYTNLIRLGMFWGQGSGAYDKGTFNQDWGCHSPEIILHLYKTLCARMVDGPFGPFDSLTLLIGDKNARKFCDKNNLNCPLRPSTS